MHERARDVPPYTGSEIRLRDDTMPVAHFALAVESVGWSHPDFFTFQLLQALIGQWQRAQAHGANASSRFVELVASEQLAHSVQPFNCCYNDTGLFGVYAVGEHAQLDNLANAVCEEFVRLGYNVSEAEVARAKALVKAGNMCDGTSETAEVKEKKLFVCVCVFVCLVGATLLALYDSFICSRVYTFLCFIFLFLFLFFIFFCAGDWPSNGCARPSHFASRGGDARRRH